MSLYSASQAGGRQVGMTDAARSPEQHALGKQLLMLSEHCLRAFVAAPFEGCVEGGVAFNIRQVSPLCVRVQVPAKNGCPTTHFELLLFGMRPKK